MVASGPPCHAEDQYSVAAEEPGDGPFATRLTYRHTSKYNVKKFVIACDDLQDVSICREINEDRDSMLGDFLFDHTFIVRKSANF